MVPRADDKSRHLYLNNVDNTMISHTCVKLEIDKSESKNTSQADSEVEGAYGELDENTVPELDLNKLRKHEEEEIDDDSSIGSCTSDTESVISYLNRITLELQDKLNTVRADYQFNLSSSSIKTSSRRSGTRMSRIVFNHTEDAITNTKAQRGNRMLYDEDTFKEYARVKSVNVVDNSLVRNEDEAESLIIGSQKCRETRHNPSTFAALSRNKYLDENDQTQASNEKVLWNVIAKKACEPVEENKVTVVDTISNIVSDLYNNIGYPELESHALDNARDNANSKDHLSGTNLEGHIIDRRLDEHKSRNTVPRYESVSPRNFVIAKPKNAIENTVDCYNSGALVDELSKDVKFDPVDIQENIGTHNKSGEDIRDMINQNSVNVDGDKKEYADAIEAKMEVKDISECSLDYLIQLSKVNEKCALLNGEMTPFLCENDNKSTMANRNLPHTEGTNKCVPKPWFKYPLVERLKPIKSDTYDVFNTSCESRKSPYEYDRYSRDIERYIKEQSTYRLDVEDCDRHNVMDPFLEYERVKNKEEDLQDTEWAKYGRPISKQCRIVKNNG